MKMLCPDSVRHGSFRYATMSLLPIARDITLLLKATFATLHRCIEVDLRNTIVLP